MKTNKKELTVFALCAYAIPFLMMPLLYICLQNGRDTSIFANAQMFYPAAGVMLAFLLARRQGTPNRFYILHIAATALMLAMSVLSAFLPQEGWLNIANFVIIIASVLGWIFLLTEKKTKREACGLRLHGKLLTALVICVYFLAVKTAMVFLSMAMQGGDSWAEYLAYWRTSAPWVMAVVLVPNFFLIELSAVFWRGIRLALLPDASPARPLRRTARRTGRWCAVGPVASAAESFLLQPRHLTAEHCRTACCLRDARCIFYLCV